MKTSKVDEFADTRSDQREHKKWPKCRNCKIDLVLSNIDFGFCNVNCRDQYRCERT